jgi:truncated hemoglobin YjbI
MSHALDETGCAPELKPRLMEAFFQTADWMRNREG